MAKLRRSLDDAEGVSMDTKKEWAFLRSENIALEELKVSEGAGVFVCLIFSDSSKQIENLRGMLQTNCEKQINFFQFVLEIFS